MVDQNFEIDHPLCETIFVCVCENVAPVFYIDARTEHSSSVISDSVNLTVL